MAACRQQLRQGFADVGERTMSSPEGKVGKCGVQAQEDFNEGSKGCKMSSRRELGLSWSLSQEVSSIFQEAQMKIAT